jgi:hypothetical protein
VRIGRAYACPNGVHDAYPDTGQELLPDTADLIWEEDSHIEAWKVPLEMCQNPQSVARQGYQNTHSCLHDNIADGSVVQSLPRSRTFGVPNTCKDHALIEIDAVVRNIAVYLLLAKGRRSRS